MNKQKNSKTTKATKKATCNHPPHRQFAWFAISLDGMGETLCVGCCQCGKILKS